MRGLWPMRRGRIWIPRCWTPSRRGGVGHLFHAVHRLGTNPKFGALRGYSANLTAPLTPLDEAILTLHRAAGRPTRFVTFASDSPYPLLAEDLAAKVAVIPEPARQVLGQLVLNIVDAHTLGGAGLSQRGCQEAPGGYAPSEYRGRTGRRVRLLPGSRRRRPNVGRSQPVVCGREMCAGPRRRSAGTLRVGPGAGVLVRLGDSVGLDSDPRRQGG